MEITSDQETAAFSNGCYYEFLQSAIMKRASNDLMRPVANIIYNTIYPYVWTICIYNVLVFLLILANFFLLLKLYWKLDLTISSAAASVFLASNAAAAAASAHSLPLKPKMA